MIYVKEIEYEIINPHNYQERYLLVPDWKNYFNSAIFCEYLTKPKIDLPITFKLLTSDWDDQSFVGIFSTTHKGVERYFIHMSRVVDKKNIPYDVYIAEVNFTKREGLFYDDEGGCNQDNN